MVIRRQQKPMARATLAGASVVVTRDASASASFKRRIAALGGKAIGLPGVSVRATTDAAAARVALRAARSARYAIFASPNAVRHAFALLPNLRFARTTCVCAVGRATAAALARRGLRDVLWPAQRQDSEGLLALPALHNGAHGKAVLIGAPGGRDLISTTLRARGVMPQSIDVYQRVAPRWNRRHLDAIEHAPAPILTLLSSAQVLAHLAGALPTRLFARLIGGECIVSSARLAQAAHAAGFARVHLAASANLQDMLDAAAIALAQHRL